MNASALTGNLDITLSAQNDVLTMGAGNDSYRATAGNDTITLGAGNDTVFYTAEGQSLTDATSEATILGSIDKITDWSNGDNTINLNGLATSFVELNAGTQTAVGTAGNLKAAADAVMNQLSANQSAAFQFDGNTYVVAEQDGDTVLENDDFMIQLQGLQDVAATDVVFA